MSALTIIERFAVDAPVERVWRYLLDPGRIVVCLPGAQLLSIEDERTYHGQMKVKVGPVTVAYKGKIELTCVDEAARLIRMSGKGSESGGTGSARMDMTCHLTRLDSGATEVAVEADVQLAGRIVRFGRGMIKGVSEQLFKQFADSVRELIETEEAAAAAPVNKDATDARPAAAESAEAEIAAQPGPTEAQGAEISAAAEPPRAADTEIAAAAAPTEAEPARPPAGESAPPAGAEPRTDAIPREQHPLPATARTMRTLEPRAVKPVRALPLLVKALWHSIASFFGRLLGRKPS